jgi:hypothetical protein
MLQVQKLGFSSTKTEFLTFLKNSLVEFGAKYKRRKESKKTLLLSGTKIITIITMKKIIHLLFRDIWCNDQ